MDFSFSQEQLAAVEAARAVFSGVAPDAVPSPALTAGAVAEDFDRPLWRRLASADLLGLVLDETYGGAGLDPVALCLVLCGAGAVPARVPLLETCAAALAVQADGPEELCDRLLPRWSAATWCRPSPRRAAPATTARSSPSPHGPRTGTPPSATQTEPRPPATGCSTASGPPSPGPRTPTTSWSRPAPPAAAPSSPSSPARRSPRPSRSRRAVSATP